MKSLRNAVLTATLTVLLVSCHKGFVYRIFNNSGEDIILWSYDTKMNATEYVIKSGRAEDVANPCRLSVKQVTSGREWVYDPVPLSKEYWYSRSSFGKTDVRFQLEPDGGIFVLAPGTQAIVSKFVAQPTGFPLRPRKVN
jgi:hypothetical protein